MSWEERNRSQTLVTSKTKKVTGAHTPEKRRKCDLCGAKEVEEWRGQKLEGDLPGLGVLCAPCH